MTRLGRVTGRSTFADLRVSGRRGRGGVIWIQWLPAPDGDPRLALAVGRAVGTAVVRNRVRRRLRAIMQAVAPRLAPGTYLLGARPAAAERSFQELQTDVTSILRQLGAVA